MRLTSRILSVSFVLGTVLALGLGALSYGRAIALSPHVVMIDNDTPFRPAGNPGTGLYGFGPTHIAVTKGDTITFDNPSTSKYPHTVTSISWTGTAPTRTLASGAQFDSSPTTDKYIQPGTSFALDTSTLDPGQYVYYCTVHPYMVGTFTVAPAS